ncbi:MAG: c-type cytochrome [Polyangiaceae bacterium]|nr:c-type cytochrome [Polyangiaceae bacterium]
MIRIIGVSLIASASLLFGCGGAQPEATTEATPAAQPEAGTQAEDGEAQADRGAKLYAEHCASCHGASGEGDKAPAVVGKSALPLDPPTTAKGRTMQFKTALDVAQFVVKNMPPDKPGSLSESEYWDILAFDLKANGVDVAGKKIDATTAAQINLH